jgi:hypothetical protein
MASNQPDLDEQRRRAEAANAELARHERLTRIVLLVVIILNAILLVLVMAYLLSQQWSPKSLLGFISARASAYQALS